MEAGSPDIPLCSERWEAMTDLSEPYTAESSHFFSSLSLIPVIDDFPSQNNCCVRKKHATEDRLHMNSC